MIPSINLLSRRRKELLRRRHRVRLWSLTLGFYVMGLVVAWSAYATGMRTLSPAEALADVQVRLDARETERKILEKDLAKLRAQIDLIDAVTDHPDWSHLLRLIARANGEEVALQRLTITMNPGAAGMKGSDLPVRGPWSVAMTGVAPSQRTASEFVARLERLGVFQTVTLTETRERADPDASSAQVDFSVSCALGNARPTERRP
ncbi:MAG: hypothetical protein HBSAPP03_24740 [Phycisphaerae bacterium]|nr:MAG: hypothetical protein HBSAPP03_24740 [Phycisphaerae bacterium]